MISVASFIPIPPFGTGEYQIYHDIVDLIANIRRLFVNLGLLLLTSGLFFGAISMKNLSDEGQRGMFIAIGILIMCFIFNLAFTGVFGY